LIVRSLTLYHDVLVAAGAFSVAGEVGASRIAQWNGSSWSSLGGSGMNSYVLALSEYQGALVAGGAFRSAGDASANRVAEWDGSVWSPLGDGITGAVTVTDFYGTTVYDPKVYALAV